MGYFVATLAALSLVGCGGAESLMEPSAQQLSGWEAPSEYRFVLDSRCGERDPLGRFRVVVRGGQVAEVRALDELGKDRYSRSRLVASLPTLTDLEAVVQEARDAGADVADIEYGAPPGDHPERVNIDYQVDATDDEVCYDVSDYSDGDGTPPPPS